VDTFTAWGFGKQAAAGLVTFKNGLNLLGRKIGTVTVQSGTSKISALTFFAAQKSTYAAGGTRAFLAESLRAIFGPRSNLILAAHIRLLPVAYLAKLVTGAPLWLFIYGIDAWEKPKNPLLTWLARRVDRVISISEVTTQRFQSWAKSPDDRYRLLPCTVDLELFRPGARDPALVAPQIPVGGKQAAADGRPQAHAPLVFREKSSLEQVHLYLGVPSIAMPHRERFACYILNAILGGAASRTL